MNRQKVGKWLTVEELNQGLANGRKTRIWVVTGSDDSTLGEIGWYAPWRQYTFTPDSGRITLNRTCLADLSGFLDARTREHYERLTARADSR